MAETNGSKTPTQEPADPEQFDEREHRRDRDQIHAEERGRKPRVQAGAAPQPGPGEAGGMDDVDSGSAPVANGYEAGE